jgi:hypothetical protein
MAAFQQAPGRVHGDLESLHKTSQDRDNVGSTGGLSFTAKSQRARPCLGLAIGTMGEEVGPISW